MTNQELVLDLERRNVKTAGLAAGFRELPAHNKILYGLSLAAALSTIARGVDHFSSRSDDGGDFDRLESFLDGDTQDKQASIGVSLLAGLANLSPFLATNIRHLSTWAKVEGADNAWSDALREKPIRALVPGLKMEFKQTYIDSPYAADRLLDQF